MQQTMQILRKLAPAAILALAATACLQAATAAAIYTHTRLRATGLTYWLQLLGLLLVVQPDASDRRRHTPDPPG